MSKLKSGIIKWLGLILVLSSLGFIAQQLFSLDLQNIPSQNWAEFIGIAVIGGVIYGILSFSQSVTWYHLLLWSGEHNAKSKNCHGIYGRTQLAKYIPGNIFSIAGRHLLGRKSGLTDSALAWAAVLEILGMLFISAVLFSIGGIFLTNITPLVGLPLTLAAALLPFVFPWAMKLVLQYIPKLKAYTLPSKTIADYFRLYSLFFLYVPFFLGGAGVLWCLIYISMDGPPPSFFIILSVSAGAWLAGYVTPGASGGIGIRDALLILALKPIVGDAIIIATVGYRFSTIVGDIVYFLFALLIPIEIEESTPAAAKLH